MFKVGVAALALAVGGGWPPFAVLHGQDKLFVVEGRLVGPSTAPVAGTVLVTEVVPQDSGMVIRQRTYQTDRGGRFSFESDSPREKTVVGKAEGFMSSERQVAFGPGQRFASVDLNLTAAGKVGGLVLDEADSAVSGATVRVRYPGTRRRIEFSHEMGEVQSNDVGVFTLPMVAKDSPFVLDVMTEDRPMSSSQTLVLSTDSRENVVIHVSRKGQTVRGQVISVEGQPALGAEVRLRVLPAAGDFTTGQRAAFSFRESTVKQTGVGTDGRFEFRGLPTGRAVIVARRPGQKPVMHEVEVIPGFELADIVITAP